MVKECIFKNKCPTFKKKGTCGFQQAKDVENCHYHQDWKNEQDEQTSQNQLHNYLKERFNLTDEQAEIETIKINNF